MGLIIFIIGLFVGSFLNCIIYRLPYNESFLRGRSYCPKCKHKLAFYDLVPLFSFLILKGKCRYCKEKISIQYPLIELTTGIIFFSLFKFYFSFSNPYNFLNLFFLSIFSCFLIIIFAYDSKHYIIPDKITYPAIVIALFYNLFLDATSQNLKLVQLNNSVDGIIAAAISSLFLLSLFLFSRGRWLGLGDVKLVIFMGLFLGFPEILVALFLAYFIGAIIGVGLIILKKKGLKSEIPFGPFLVTGTFLALFFGSNLVNWYLGFLK